MTETTDKEEIHEEIKYQTISEFLETSPPSQVGVISDLSIYVEPRGLSYKDNCLYTPNLQLHCPHDSCNGIRFFRCTDDEYDETLKANEYRYIYVNYRCSNCRTTRKTYSLAVKLAKDEGRPGECYKFGELPTFGPPVSPKLITLIGSDRETFLKGRRCENQGLGIGAFIYYRRVVENQKNRILERIIAVSEKIAPDHDKIKILKKATVETQFSKALDMAKDAMPESLLINGHSPIRLLHSALSEGVHELSDNDCLQLASSVRIVLGELSDRLANALKDEAELANALTTLMNRDKIKDKALPGMEKTAKTKAAIKNNPEVT